VGGAGDDLPGPDRQEDAYRQQAEGGARAVEDPGQGERSQKGERCGRWYGSEAGEAAKLKGAVQGDHGHTEQDCGSDCTRRHDETAADQGSQPLATTETEVERPAVPGHRTEDSPPPVPGSEPFRDEDGEHSLERVQEKDRQGEGGTALSEGAGRAGHLTLTNVAPSQARQDNGAVQGTDQVRREQRHEEHPSILGRACHDALREGVRGAPGRGASPCYPHPVTEDPRYYRAAYLQTIYHAAGEAFRLREVPSGLILFKGRRFGLVTAANPRSAELGTPENETRNAVLAAELAKLDLEVAPSYGADDARTWREDGFLLWDVDAETLLEVGRRHEQNAVVYGDGERVFLGWCDDLSLEPFWPERARHPGEGS
jgi:hypothetical protein